jgi:surface polysaccharide O-acyltransferase-like enzyme
VEERKLARARCRATSGIMRIDQGASQELQDGRAAAAAATRTREWDPTADIVRVVAIAMVVVLHVAAGLIYSFGRIPGHWWWVTNAIDTLMRPAVPLLVTLSGMLLLGDARELTLWQFARRRTERVLVPFVAWGSLYLAWSFYSRDAAFSWRAIASTVIHLGFLYALLGLYLATPILRVYVQKASRGNLRYFLVLWFVAASLAPLFTYFSHAPVGLPFVVATGYSGYFILGYYLSNVRLHAPGQLAAIGLFILMAGATALGTYCLTVRASGALDETIYGYISPNVVVMAVCAFLLLRSIPVAPALSRAGSRSQRALRFVSRVSFGIYLIHPLFLELLASGVIGVTLTGAFVHPAVGIWFTGAVVFGLSLLAVAVLRKLPVVRRLLVPD